METIDIIRGKTINRITASNLREHAARAERVMVDVGCGDGRTVYRTARANSTWLCIGVDANAAGLRDSSYRASRKPARGGTPNAVFIRASLAELPGGLEGIADEVLVLYPWRSLLAAALGGAELGNIARLGTQGCTFEIRINNSALEDPIDSAMLNVAYARAGITLETMGQESLETVSTWGARTSHGRDGEVLVIEGRCDLRAHGLIDNDSTTTGGARWNSTHAQAASSRSTAPRST